MRRNNVPAITDVSGVITIRPTVDDDAGGLARVLIDTRCAAHPGMLPDRLLDFPPLDQSYVRSQRNWRGTMREIGAMPRSRERVFDARCGNPSYGWEHPKIDIPRRTRPPAA